MIQTKLKICSGCKQLKKIWKSDKKDKYCQQCWYERKPPERIRSVSTKMQKTMDTYSKQRMAFLSLHSTCQAKIPGCTGTATDVHHTAGRGDNHNKMSTWLALCRNCHTFIELNPEFAKEAGFSQSRLKKQDEIFTDTTDAAVS